MKKGVKIALYAAPILVGVYLIYRQFVKPTATDLVDVPPVNDATTRGSGKTNTVPPDNSTTNTSSVFPLQVGSNNPTVKALQVLLNSLGATPALVADSKFGPKTLAALVSITGKQSVDSSEEFNAIGQKSSTQSLKGSNYEWASKLVNAYNDRIALGLTDLVARVSLSLPEYSKNFQGLWKPTGKVLTINAGQVLNLEDYALRSPTSDGSLRIEVTNGDLAGNYITDAGLDLRTALDIQ